jgi:nitroreductase
MNVSEAIRTKRATRKFTAQPVSAESMRSILDAGRRAQSSKNTQPWHFIVVRERELLKNLAAVGPYAGHLAGAAFGIAVASSDPAGRWSIGFDLGQAAAYMQLAAWELGIGSCIGSMYDPEKARALLGVPDDLTVQVALSFGYPAAPQSAQARLGGRRPLAEVVHWDKW